MESRSQGRLSLGWQALREALSGAHHDYTEGHLGRAVVLLAIPMVLEMAMEALFAICDAYFVGRLGDVALATVGLTESMMTIFYAIGIGLAMATTATVARRVGEKDIDGAVRAGAQGIYLGLFVGVAIGIPCYAYAPDLLGLMGAEQEVIDQGSGYASLMLGANVVILLLFLDNAVFRGAGDAVVAMKSLALANAINIVLDPCLIFGLGPFPELGLTGAAVATTTGRGIGVAYQFWALRRGSSRIAMRTLPPVDFGRMGKLLKVSLGGIGQMLIATTSWVALMRIVADFGSEALAGYTIAIRIIIFTLLPSWGLGNAAATLVGQCLGAGKPDRAERAVWWTGIANTVFLGVVTVVFLTLGPSLIAIFNAENDPVTAETGAQALEIISYGYLFYGWAMVLTQAFNGAGDTRTPTWINFFCFWMLQIPLAFGLAQHIDQSGVFWAVAIAESVLAVVAFTLFKRGEWKQQMV